MNNITKNDVCVGIVLFNPDITRLKNIIKSIRKQCNHIILFDNSINGIDYIVDGVVYLSENKNTGVAHALNCILTEAEKKGYKWVLTLDQDSNIPDNLMSKYLDKANECDDNIAIICPQINDRRRKYITIVNDINEEYVNFAITSGSFTNVDKWSKVGKFDEFLFIDLVDNEFCIRIKLNNYKIIKLNSVILDHEYGNIITKSKMKCNFWINLSKILHNKNIAKLSYKKIVDSKRVYYTCRNIKYLKKKYKDYMKEIYNENYNCNSYFGFIISFIIPSIIRSKNKIETIKCVLKANKD